MSKHECPRCGFESKHDAWYDRHPFAAVVFVVVVGFVVLSVTLAKPWFFVPLLVVGGALAVNRASRRRQAIAARAEYEYRREMLAVLPAGDFRRAGLFQPFRPPYPTPLPMQPTQPIKRGSKR